MSRLKIELSEQDHTKGSAEAGLTLVEYGDYECPHCAHAYAVVERIEKHYGNKLRFVFRNFPLTQIHANAQAAAEVAEFAASKGKFWEMHGLLFENFERLGSERYQELALELGIDAMRLKHDLDEGTFTDRVRTDFTGGVRSGVNGTPTFFINGDRHNGPLDFEGLAGALDKASSA